MESPRPSEPAPRARTRCLVRTDWHTLDDERLLDLRVCELGLTIEGSVLEERIACVDRELEARGLQFRPYYWLSDDWFTPDHVPGVAIPFYLAHPRLSKLEESQMLEVEGGTHEWCLQILRHEVGHAVDNAYMLQRRHKRLKVFGQSKKAYPEYYTPKPYSKSFVVHLDSWYAQSHPDEDFAETFAVWLTPDGDWHERFKDWPAVKKIEYVDGLMKDIAGKPPAVRTRRRVDPVHTMRKTLREHYARKRKHYGVERPNFYDRDLRRLFSDEPQYRGNMKASRFIARIKRDVRRRVAEATGEYQYTIDQVIEDMIRRANDLGLRLKVDAEKASLDFVILLTVQTMNYLHSGRHRVAL
ncbi:MAG: putative zinc-binding metallopeptidase [Acidobacteriota bacterium]|nr:putative zinc-binding metallopeptidase [Acidobacteriota bacterium]